MRYCNNGQCYWGTSVEEPAGIVDEVLIREVESKWNIFIIAGLLIRLIIIFRISDELFRISDELFGTKG